VERTIALRPYPALRLFRDAMYAALRDKLPPDVWTIHAVVICFAALPFAVFGSDRLSDKCSPLTLA